MGWAGHPAWVQESRQKARRCGGKCWPLLNLNKMGQDTAGSLHILWPPDGPFSVARGGIPRPCFLGAAPRMGGRCCLARALPTSA